MKRRSRSLRIGGIGRPPRARARRCGCGDEAEGAAAAPGAHAQLSSPAGLAGRVPARSTTSFTSVLTRKRFAPLPPQALAASQHLNGALPCDRRRGSVASHHHIQRPHRRSAGLLVHFDFTVSLARCRSCRNTSKASAAPPSTFSQGKMWSAAALAWCQWLPHSTLSKEALLSVHASL